MAIASLKLRFWNRIVQLIDRHFVSIPYWKDVLTRLPKQRASQIFELLPNRLLHATLFSKKEQPQLRGCSRKVRN
ncbi:hypothetical protein BGP83_19995 [Pseudomonas putida]|nr:hypothetical protein BGP83_19995 [Pseudomonas putida]